MSRCRLEIYSFIRASKWYGIGGDNRTTNVASKRTSVPSKRKKSEDRGPFWRWFLGEIIGLLRQFGNTLIWAAVTCYFVYSGAKTFQAYAGKVSIANLALQIAAHINIVIAASVALSGLTTILWANECRRHRSTRKRLTARTEALELRLDPKRESSLLTREGTTREGDQ